MGTPGYAISCQASTVRVYNSNAKPTDVCSPNPDSTVQKEFVEVLPDDILEPPPDLVVFNYDAALRSIVDFERNMATRRRRLYEAALADRRKVVAASSTEFEAPFSSKEDCVSRLLPFHACYSRENTIDNVFNEDAATSGRRKRSISEAGLYIASLRQRDIVNNELNMPAEVSLLGKLVSTQSAENDRLRREIYQRSIPSQRLQQARQFPAGAHTHVMSHNLLNGPIQRLQWNQ